MRIVLLLTGLDSTDDDAMMRVKCMFNSLADLPMEAWLELRDEEMGMKITTNGSERGKLIILKEESDVEFSLG